MPCWKCTGCIDAVHCSGAGTFAIDNKIEQAMVSSVQFVSEILIAVYSREAHE